MKSLCVAGIAGLLSIGMASAQVNPGHSHIADAKRESAAVLAFPEEPCTGQDASTTTSGYEGCMTRQLSRLEPHLEAFVAAMRGIAQEFDQPPAKRGTLPSTLASFNKTDASWRKYRDDFCRLSYSWFDGGTGAAPAEQQCLYQLDRAYVKNLANWANLHQLAD